MCCIITRKLIVHSPHRPSYILCLVPQFPSSATNPMPILTPWSLTLTFSSGLVLQEVAFFSLCLGSFLIYQSLFVWGKGRSLILFPVRSSVQQICQWQLYSELPSVPEPSEGIQKSWIVSLPCSSHSKIPSLFLEGNDNWLIGSSFHL